MEDNIVYFDKDTPKIAQANKVRSLLAVNGDDDTIGAVEFDLLVLEAGKHVGEAVKLNGLVLPTLGDVNKKTTVRGGANGKIFTYTDPITSQITTLNVGVNKVADLFWDGLLKNWSKVEEESLPLQDLSGVLQKSEIGKSSLNYNQYILENTVITTAGTIGTNPTQYAGAKSIVDMPIPLGDWTLGGYVVNAGKNLAIVNSTGQVKAGSIQTLGTSKVTFKIENDGFNLLRAFFKSMNTSEPSDSGWINSMTISPGAEYIPFSVNELENKPIYAKGLTSDNAIPDPVADHNGVNLNYLKLFGLLVNDLTVTPSKNLAPQELNITLIPNKYIGNNGSIATGQYWMMYKFYPLRNGLKAGDPFVIGGFTINTAGYSAWYKGQVLKTFNGSYQNSNLPMNFVVPIDASNDTILYFDVARPVDLNNYANLTINYGTTLLPYENPYGTITKIKGRNIGAGASIVSKFEDLIDVPKYLGNANKAFKVNANENGIEVFTPVEQHTDVDFLKVRGAIGEFETLVMDDVPVWDELGVPPIEVGFGYLFPDGSGNYFSKVRGV